MDSFQTSLLAVLITATAICGDPCALAKEKQHKEVTATQLVDLLGHQAYHTRSRARRQLLALGPTDEVRDALGKGLRSKSLEIHQACLSLLQTFEINAFDQELERLTSPHIYPGEVELLGWNQFSSLAGDDAWSRRLYSRVARQHYLLIRKLVKTQGKYVSSKQDFIARADPYRLANHDAVSWALLLFCDSIDIDHGRPDLSARLLNSLSHSGLGPTRLSAGDKLVIQRLIDQWLTLHSKIGTVRDRLLVAMRYGCESQADELSRHALADASATASALTTAMLCASMLGHDDLREQLIRRLDDDRTAHVWQLIASRQKKIRTQVRDVALALLLHQEGVDPRHVGYVELQADPLLLFRDHSLGFADEASRQIAHQKGNALLRQ